MEPNATKASALQSFEAVHMMVDNKPAHAVFLTAEKVPRGKLKLTFTANGKAFERTVSPNFYFVRV